MPRRTVKTLCVEIFSSLALFALVGTMTSTFWERHLIQAELSNMKTSLHILKETVCNIGAAYDKIHNELRGLGEMKKIKVTKTTPKELTYMQSKCIHSLTKHGNMLIQEVMDLKSNKTTGITEPIGKSYRNSPTQQAIRHSKNATTITRNPLKSTGINMEHEQLNMHSNDNRYNIYLTRNKHKYCSEDHCCGSENNFED